MNEEEQYTVQDLQDNLNYLDDTKNLIKNAIITKGQSVSANDTFRSFVDKILAIETSKDYDNIPIWYSKFDAAIATTFRPNDEIQFLCGNTPSAITSAFTRIDDYDTVRTAPMIGDVLINETTGFEDPDNPGYYNKRYITFGIITNVEVGDTINVYTYLIRDGISREEYAELIGVDANDIREGVSILGVTGTLEEGIDTSDATATADDLINPKTAYVDGQKITGNIIMTTESVLDPTFIETNFNIGLNSNFMIITPDNKCIINTNTNGNVILTNIDTGISMTYSYSSLGITNGTTSNYGVKAISICKTPNSYGAYLVVFMTRSSWSDSITAYTSCCYYKDGQLAYVKDSSQNTYYNSLTRNSDWGRVSIIASNTKANTFLIIPAGGYYNRGGRTSGNSLIVTVAENLKSYTSVSLGKFDGDYSYQHSIAKLSNDDKFLALCHKGDNSNSNALSILNDNLQQLTFNSTSTYNRAEFFYKDNITYLLDNNIFYKLIYESSGSTYSKVPLGNSNILESTYREIVHTDNLIMTLDSDNKYRLYNYDIDDTLGLSVTLIKAFNSSVTFNPAGIYLAATSNKIYYTNSNNIITELNILNIGDLIPVKIHKDLYDLYNTYDADAIAANILNTKVAYSKSGKVTGTMPNNGQINITPSTSQQSIPAGYTTGGTVDAVTSDIDSDIIPENIKSGVNILGIEGTYEGTDTSDANATANDIVSPRTAYVNGQKITGAIIDLYTFGTSYITKIEANNIETSITANCGNPSITKKYRITTNSKCTTSVKNNDLASAISLTADKIKSGETILGVNGTYTSDANATASDIAKDKTAYVNGQKITGTLEAGGLQPVVIPDLEIDNIIGEYNHYYWHYYTLPEVQGVDWSTCTGIFAKVEKYNEDLDQWEQFHDLQLDYSSPEQQGLNYTFGMVLSFWNEEAYDETYRVAVNFLFNTGVFSTNTIPVEVPVPETCTLTLELLDNNANQIPSGIITANDVTVKNSNDEDVPFEILNDYWTFAIRILSKENITVTVNYNGSQIYTDDFYLANEYESKNYVINYERNVSISFMNAYIDNNSANITYGEGKLEFYDDLGSLISTKYWVPGTNYSTFIEAASYFIFTYTAINATTFIHNSQVAGETVDTSNIVFNSVPQNKVLLNVTFSTNKVTNRNESEILLLSEASSVDINIFDGSTTPATLTPITSSIYGSTISAYVDVPNAGENIEYVVTFSGTNYESIQYNEFNISDNDGGQSFNNNAFVRRTIFIPTSTINSNDLNNKYSLDKIDYTTQLYNNATITQDQGGKNHIYLNSNSVNDGQAINSGFTFNAENKTCEFIASWSVLADGDYLFGINGTNGEYLCYAYYDANDGLVVNMNNNKFTNPGLDATFLAQEHIYHFVTKNDNSGEGAVIQQVCLYIDKSLEAIEYYYGGLPGGFFNLNTDDLITYSKNKADVTMFNGYEIAFTQGDCLAHWKDYVHDTEVYGIKRTDLSGPVIDARLSYDEGIDEHGDNIWVPVFKIKNSGSNNLPQGTTLTVAYYDTSDNLIDSGIDITPAEWSSADFEPNDEIMVGAGLEEAELETLGRYELTFTVPPNITIEGDDDENIFN